MVIFELELDKGRRERGRLNGAALKKWNEKSGVDLEMLEIYAFVERPVATFFPNPEETKVNA